MAINTLDPKSEEEKDPLAMPMAELPASEVGGGGMANALPVLTSTPSTKIPPTVARPPEPPTLSRTAEQAVASGTVIPGKIETDSVTTTVKSPESTRKVKSQETQDAANDLEFQKRRIVEATETQMDAENKIDQVALAAESRRLELERSAAEEEALKRQEIENKRVEAEAAADKELADADARVKEKQDAAINWNKGRVPFKILSAVMRAAAIPDAVRMNANADPMNNPVARTLDAALAEEKKVKQEEFLASKEWRDALKTKNAEHIKRTYDRGIAKLNIDVTAKARNLLMSEKADQLAQRTAKLDPNGDAYRGAKDVALATLNAQDARDRITLSQPYEATVSSGGKTITTVNKTTEGSKGSGKDPSENLVTYNGVDFPVRGGTAEAASARKKAAATQTMTKMLSEYETLLSEGASPITTGKRRAEIESMIGKLTGKIKEAEELGALDNGVIRLVNGVVGNPLEWKSLLSGGSTGVLKKVQEARFAAQEAMADTFKTHGNDPKHVDSVVLGRSSDSKSDITPERLKGLSIDKLRVGLERAQDPNVKAMIQAEIERKEGSARSATAGSASRPLDKR
jgi:hypothetical protein